MTEQEEIQWERDHPITHALLMALGQDRVRLSVPQTLNITRIVGKMETDLHQSKKAQHSLRNHIIWHIERNNQLAAYSK
jgi:hypothetical protein